LPIRRGNSRPEVNNGRRPADLRSLQIIEQELPNGLFLRLHCALGEPGHLIRGRYQKPVGELWSGGLREKAVDVSFLDRVLRLVRLRLDGPEVAVMCLPDQVYAGVDPPTSRPVVPEPDLLNLSAVDRVVEEIPPTNRFELAAASPLILVQGREENLEVCLAHGLLSMPRVQRPRIR
jgi:hypothetical protein